MGLDFEIDDNGYVMLPGSEGWRGAYEEATKIERLFPGNDAFNFFYAIEYNDPGPIVPGVKITDLHMIQEGQNDGPEWIWRVTLSNGQTWKHAAWCDYTGFDCQSCNSWTRWSDKAVHCETCSCG